MHKVCTQRLFYFFCAGLLLLPFYAIAKNEKLHNIAACINAVSAFADLEELPTLSEDILTNDMPTRVGIDIVINTNLILQDSIISTVTDSPIGNIMKPSPEGKLVRFINNWGTDNTFVGIRSGSNFASTGNANTGFGINTLRNVTSGSNNTAVGANALRPTTTGSGNVGVGSLALAANTVGSDNVAVGVVALASNISGSSNVAIGRSALNKSEKGVDNVAVGYQALLSNRDNDNVAVGFSAAQNLQSGDNNIFIGSSCGSNVTSGSGNIYIGNSIQPSAGTQESNTIRIGSPTGAITLRKCFIANIQKISGFNFPLVYVNPNGQLGVFSSSRRFKHAISVMTDESEGVYALRPVTFIYNQDETETRQLGLIAEEVDQELPELVAYDKDGAPYSVHYEMLPVLLLNEMKKQKQEMQLQDQDVDTLLQTVQMLREKIQTLMTN